MESGRRRGVEAVGVGRGRDAMRLVTGGDRVCVPARALKRRHEGGRKQTRSTMARRPRGSRPCSRARPPDRRITQWRGRKSKATSQDAHEKCFFFTG
jgi:hypothetical protein